MVDGGWWMEMQATWGLHLGTARHDMAHLEGPFPAFVSFFLYPFSFFPSPIHTSSAFPFVNLDNTYTYVPQDDMCVSSAHNKSTNPIIIHRHSNVDRSIHAMTNERCMIVALLIHVSILGITVSVHKANGWTPLSRLLRPSQPHFASLSPICTSVGT